MSKPTEAQRRDQIDRTVKQLVDGGSTHKYAHQKARELAYKADKKDKR